MKKVLLVLVVTGLAVFICYGSAQAGDLIVNGAVIQQKGVWQNTQFICSSLTVDQTNRKFTCASPKANVYLGQGIFKTVPIFTNTDLVISEKHICMALGGLDQYSKTQTSAITSDMAAPYSYLLPTATGTNGHRITYYSVLNGTYATIASVTCTY
jgi:hypothetical protein